MGAIEEIDVTGLKHIEGFLMPVYFSSGDGQRARGIAARAEQVIDWLGKLVELPAIPPLFVLDPGDWARIAPVGQYGLAHVRAVGIFMGQQQSGLWASLASEVWPDIPAVGRRRLETVYGVPPDFSPFAALVIAHELTHLAYGASLAAGAGDDARHRGESKRLLWLNELFANVAMQGYVADREPESLSVLETLFEVVGAIPAARWPFKRLDQMYDSIHTPGVDGMNYVWFEFRLQILAKRLWQARGAAGFRRLHEFLRGPMRTDEQAVEVLAEVDRSVAELVSSDLTSS